MTMKIKHLASVARLTLALAACKDYLTETPQDFLTPANFPSTEPDLKIALGGIEPGVVPPGRADDLGGSRRADHAHQQHHGLEARAGQVHLQLEQRVVVA